MFNDKFSNIVERFIANKFDELKNNKYVKNEIKNYIRRSYISNSSINTLVFKGESKKLKDLYIPLTIVKNTNNRYEKEFLVDRYDEEFMFKYRNILLVDNAGMGKSTIMKYLYVNCVEEEKGIPIFIELRNLKEQESIVSYISKEISGLGKSIPDDKIIDLIRKGKFLFFFDGYDEIIPEIKEEITKNLQDFICRVYDSQIIISSREEGELMGFRNFHRFDIKPLEKYEAYNLIRKYDNNGNVSEELIRKLEEEEDLVLLSEFLKNPLMVSLMYKAFDYRRDIPVKKHIFYRQVYDALFQDHDLSKGGAYKHYKKSRLDVEDFHKVLRYLGISSIKEGIVYNKEKLINIVTSIKKRNGDLEFSECDFIDDIVRVVPIFIKDGNEYRWVHKSFQEYFAASYICIDAKEKQKEYLEKMTSEINILKYFNILDFCYDIDYKGFKRFVIYPIIKEFEKFYINKYTDERYDDYDSEELYTRKMIEFNFKPILLRKFQDDFKTIINGRVAFGDAFENRRYYRCQFLNDEIVVASGSGKMESIINLLKNKKSHLIKKFERSALPRYKEFFYDLDYSIYEINDNCKNILNKKELFKYINTFLKSLLFQNSVRQDSFIDYYECIKLKNDIEAEIECEKDDIFI